MDGHDAIGEREQTRSLRAPSSEPSLSHRDVSGGQNRSPSRKRPRLDSGSRTARSMSADRALSAANKAAGTDIDDSPMQDDSRPATPVFIDTPIVKPALTPSRVTINVREYPKGSITPGTDGLRDSPSSLKATDAVNGMNGNPKAKEPSTSSSTSPQSDSSPLIEVAVPDSEDADDAITEIRLDDESDEDRIASLFYHFPFSTDGNYCEAAELIAEEQDKTLNFDVLIHLDRWLQDLQRCIRRGSSEWTRVFYEHSTFWEVIAKIYTRMFNKSLWKHSVQPSADVVESFAQNFLRTFANLLARIIQVDTTFFSEDAIEIDRLVLLSPKFVIAARPLLREDKGFLAKVLPLFDVDAHELRAYVIKCFVQAEGPRHLAQLIKVNFDEPYRDDAFLPKINICLQFIQNVSVYASFYLGRQEGLSEPLSDNLAKNLLEIFDTADKQLQGSLDKQQDVLTLDMRKNLLEWLGSILGSVFLLAPQMSREVFTRITERDDVELEDHYKLITVIVWKLKLAMMYITKARMDLRLHGIDAMAKELVDFFNNYKDKTNALRSPTPGPLLSFVAEFLLKKKITEYLFGVASHPQLIARSSNVIGFLVVTNNFNKEQAGLMWRTIKDSQDPRVVAASFPVFAHLIKQLADFEENVMICEIVLSESLPVMSPQGAEFLLDLLGRLRQQYQEHYHFHTGEQVEKLYHVPLELCVELIRTLSPTSPQTVNTQLVYDHAGEVLAALAPLAPHEVRKALFEKCINIVRKSTDDGAACAQAIYYMLRQNRTVPKALTQELELVSVLMNDFCQFVATQRAVDARFTMQQLNIQLWPRLDLIWFAMPSEEGNLDEQHITRFWSHTVGSDALSNVARDVAWHRLSIITFNPGMDNGFFERHQELLSPTQIEPRFFTSGFFSFIQKLATSRMRAQAMPELNDDGTIDIPGLDLIWDAFFRAPKGIGEDNTIQYLIARYLDESWLQRTSKEAVEATHIALVNESMNRLRMAHTVLRKTTADAVNGIDSGTGMLTPSIARAESELTFIRMIKFLKKFLLHVRTLKEHRSKATEVVDLSEDVKLPTYRGNMISIKCEIMRQGQRTVSRALVMGNLDTCRQLYRRICILLGDYNVSSFQLIGSGKRLYLREHPRMTLEDTGIARAPHLILREGASGEETRKDYIIPSQQWRSAFEQQLVANLETFYEFLDGMDAASSTTFDMLKSLPRYQALKEIVSNKDTAARDLFPLSQPFKIAYSLECLRELLEAGPADPAFIVHGTRLLESLLPDEQALAEGSTLNPELVADTVSCLFDFFNAGEGNRTGMFSDDASVMRRVVGLCMLGIPYAKAGSLAWDSYELSLDLLSSSEAAWHEFTSNPRVATLHEHLLFAHPEAVVRRTASQLIRRKLDQWPATATVPLPSLLTLLWSIVSSIIPKAINVSQRAAETFEVAIFLFKSLLKFGLFTKDQVEDLFIAWAPLLTTYIHYERVGRDEVDVVLRGLAALLRFAAEAVPMIAPTSQKISLMQTIWWKFLFQQNPRSHEDVPRLAVELPALESDTRTELILLLTTLATEDDTVDALCDLFGGVTIQHKFHSQVDKTCLLRSPAGYVGLKNLGQTCYMNSLVTQLFMNPVFRAFILSCAPLTRSVQSPLLFETQRLFAIMQNTYRGYSSAEDFTRKIVTLTEEVIDVREQMDVDEFMNTLFHRWEEQMPSAELKGRLRSVYTGKTVQQIKSKECEHVSEREDTCLAIPCDIQGNTTLEESLKAYIQGDVMEGDNKYKCERCDRLVDAVKRTCLKDIPNHLMLQLKRFAFDLETYSRNKINDYFAFPMTIDMSPYTFDHLANPDEPVDEDIFELVGVIVHKGQAEHGHYVSYIRARPTPAGEAATWLLFDDSDVTIFDPKDFSEACFGGLANKDTSMLFQSGLKSYNAYMLFYQRRSTLQDHPWAPQGAANLQNVPVIPDMEEEIIDDNRVLLRDYSLFDDSSREFVRNLLRMLEKLDHTSHDHQLHSKILSLVWKYLASVWARTKELPDFEEAIGYLQSICANCNQCAYISLRWLINSRRKSWNMIEDEDILRDLMLRINQPKVRQLMRSFILEALKQLRSNTDMYGADSTDPEPNSHGNGAIAIVTRLTQFIPDYLHMNFRAWEEFFGLLADIAALGPQESYTLIVDGALTACFEALLFNMGYNDTVDRRYQHVNDALKRKIGPSYNQLIRLASILFGYVNMRAEAVAEADTPQRLHYFASGGVPWTDYEETLLLDFNKKEGGLIWLCEVFQKWNFEGEGFTPGEIVRSLLSAKSAVIHGVIETFTISIKDFETRYADPFLRSAKFIPMHLQDRDFIDKFVKFIKNCSRDANGTTTRGDDGYSGIYCFRFWSAIHQIAMGNLVSRIDDPAFFDKMFLDYSREWAPSLLVYRKDWEVGRLAQRLLQDGFFKAWSKLVDEDVRDMNDQDTAVMYLFWGCDRQIRMLYNDQPWRQFMMPLYTVMYECVQFIRLLAGDEQDRDLDSIAEDEKILSRFEEVKTWFEDLPSRSDEDLELAQSSELNEEWQALEIADDAFAEASDLTEVSDEDLGAILTTDLDG